MVAPIPTHGNFVVLGPARAAWPQPLADLIESGHSGIEIVASLHEAAALLAGGAKGLTIRGLLLDPRILMLRDLEALSIIARHVRLPIVLLPIDEGASRHAKEAAHYGVLFWEQAAPGLSALQTRQDSPDRTITAREQPVPALTDNQAPASASNGGEKFVTLDVASRYDELGINPLVSAQEMAALLDGAD